MNEIKEYAFKHKVPIIQEEGLKFIKELVLNNQVKTILELGSAIGYSSIELAKLSPDISIITIERNNLMYEQCLKNVRNNQLDKQITCIYSDINMYDCNQMFDLIFVDAGKAHYLEYLNKFIKNLKKDGLMVFDNLNFHGLYQNVEAIKNRNTRSLVKKLINFMIV